MGETNFLLEKKVVYRYTGGSILLNLTGFKIVMLSEASGFRIGFSPRCGGKILSRRAGTRNDRLCIKNFIK